MACLFGAAVTQASPLQITETIAEIRVHGNHATPDADILAIAGLSIGEAATAARLQAAEQQLRASGRFEAVEIRRRYRSLADPSEILIVVLVDERPGVTTQGQAPGSLARLRTAGMWLPLLRYAEGYGFTYGARVSVIDSLGSPSHVTLPLTWGGERRAALDVGRSFSRGPLTAARGLVALSRSVNPHFDVPDTRRDALIQVERAFTDWLRADAQARLTGVTFGRASDRYASAAARLTLDTRLDPAFPRNAVHALAALEQLGLHGSGVPGSKARGAVRRWSADVHGYVGVAGPAVLALRAKAVHASAPLPPFEQHLLGGGPSTELRAGPSTGLRAGEPLRGYRAGYRAGDNLALVSAEARLPLNSPLSFGRFGIKAFADAGTAWAAGERLADQHFDRGIGGGVYFGGPAVGGGVDIAWPFDRAQGRPRRGSARWHFALGLTF